MLLVSLLVLPLCAALVVAVFGWTRTTSWFCVVDAVAMAGLATWVAIRTADGPTLHAAGGLLRADALSGFMVLLVSISTLLATSSALGYLKGELEDGNTTVVASRWYGALVMTFVATMLFALLAANVALMWVAIEATTIVTTFLVGYRRTRASLEASWKYVIIGSVGIILAFLGTILLALAARHGGLSSAHSLDWEALTSAHGRFDPGVVKLGAALLVLGYGTKVGLAPMHTWLPDAYSQAPAPVSALMSGVLSSVAFYALLRWKVVIDTVLGTEFLRILLAGAGLLSITVAALMLIAQRDYKRLLAYSSIEHMGLVAIAASIGTRLAIAALLLHVLAHGLAKGVAFICSGEMLHQEGTTDIASVRGLLVRSPFLGSIFGFSLVALLGIPPFGLFASEIAIARAGFGAGMGWVVTIAFTMLLVVAAAIVTHAQRMLFGPSAPVSSGSQVSVTTTVPLVGGLLALAAIGVSIWPIDHLLNAAASVVAR
jgi:hydrogenase-4 component F